MFERKTHQKCLSGLNMQLNIFKVFQSCVSELMKNVRNITEFYIKIIG